MSRIWRRRWWVMAAVAVVAFMSVGAVAWAESGNDSSTETTAAAGATTTTVAATATTDDDATLAGLCAAMGDGTAAQRVAAGLKQMRQRGQQWLQRQAAIMDKLRATMSPADQAQYDKLIAQFKEQRVELKKARQDLAGTLKQLRDLHNKYLPVTTTTTS